MSDCHGSAKCITGTVRIDNQERATVVHNVHLSDRSGQATPFGFIYNEKGGRVGVCQINGVWYRYLRAGISDDDVLIC